MILEAICNLFFGLINFVITFIPNTFTLPDWFLAFCALVSKAFFFFPPDVFFSCLSLITGSLVAQIGWAVVEWVYKKVPGVD